MPTTRGTLTFGWEQANDASGRPIALELTFRAPDAVPDESTRLPLNVGLAIDRSGSMQGEKIHAARQAAVGVLEALQDGERFAAAAFDTHVFDVSDSVRLTDKMRAHIRRKIESLVAGSSTALFDGFTRTAELVALGGE